METSAQVLKRIFGYDQFKSGQQELIDEILAGHDVLGIMPTGAGKSICYQIPALMMEGITLVVSPLVSLMKDQVSALVNSNVKAAYLNSSLTFPQYKKALSNAKKGMYKIIYVAPERLSTEGFLDFAANACISMVAVDEAHCVSQWGQNFRPGYLQISQFIEALPKRPVVAAFTATATGIVKQDIEKLLHLRAPYSITTGFDRPNLYFGVEQTRMKEKFIREYVFMHLHDPGIIYCPTRKKVEEVYELLCSWNLSVSKYHAGMSDESRRRAQDDFTYDRTLIMVATNAFGMGIDKSNVRYVLHYAMPGSLENYYQEAGRAGRDGEAAECILLYSKADVRLQEYFIQNPAAPNPDPKIQEEITALDTGRLIRMRQYCESQNCLRSFILEYFGQTPQGSCENCSVCKSSYQQVDVRVQAKTVYELVTSLNRSYGANMLADILKGSKSSKLLERHLDSNPKYGAMESKSRKEISELIEKLVLSGYLQRSNDLYHTITASPDLAFLLTHEKPVYVRNRIEEAKPKPMLTNEPERERRISNRPLFEMLVKFRLSIARKQGVPPYIVFTDQTLHAMSEKRPQTEEEMLALPGVGPAKMKKYGNLFLGAISQWNNSHPV